MHCYLVDEAYAEWETLQTVVISSLSCTRLSATPWTAACWTPLSMGFPRQEYGSRLPFPSPGDRPDRDQTQVSF